MDTLKSNLIPLNVAARKYAVSRRWLADEATAGRLLALIAGKSIVFDESVLASELSRRARRGYPEVHSGRPLLLSTGGA